MAHCVFWEPGWHCTVFFHSHCSLPFFFFFVISIKSVSNVKWLHLCALGLPSVTQCVGGICEVKNTHGNEVQKYDSAEPDILIYEKLLQTSSKLLISSIYFVNV